MTYVKVNIEIDGQQVPVGTISGNKDNDYRFTYNKEYLQNPKSSAISASLPLQEGQFSVQQTKNFFDGLLPEGFTRKTVAQWLHQSEDDYLSILIGLGRECLGAVQIIPENDKYHDLTPSYELLSLRDVKNLAKEGAVASAELVTKAHLSLTGASGKVGLYFDSETGDWLLPKGTAPSTHIVKQSHVRLESIVANEQLSQLTASNLGIEIPESTIINTGEGKDEDVLLATRRYDRIFDDDNEEMINGLPKPYRLHQEDFSQALGIPAADKYEKLNHGAYGYMARMFSLIRQVSKNPLQDQIKLWDRIVFCYLLGNTDSHIKNFSLLYDKNLSSISLAPAYDMVSTAIYDACTRNMAFYIGNDLVLDNISRDSFQTAASWCGINPKMAMKRFDRIADQYEQALHSAYSELINRGIPNTQTILERILQNGGYRLI